ncbi:MAG: carbon starvation protein A [bacterium]
MGSVLLMVLSFLGYIIVYHTYGRFLSRKVFKINRETLTPSHEFNDGIDYVPTKKGVIFGHHFASIAGTGPIVGPAIGIIWGWIPAFLWVFLGSIVMGAVHDFGSLIISLRNKGKSIADITSKYLNRRARIIFFLIVFFELLIVIAIFGLVIAIIFSLFPQSVFPVWFEIPIAVFLGYMVYKKQANIVLYTLFAIILMYTTVVLGHYIPLEMPSIFGMPPTGVWTIILLIYAYIASTIPVTALLQPRDYINAWELFIGMGILIIGVLATGLFRGMPMVAPAFNLHPAGAPSMWPFLFITIACGAISGFHSLVSSGTSAKQVSNEKDALFVGYGSMLLESALAVLVIIACGAGIGLAYASKDGQILQGVAAWNAHYASWSGAAGLGAKINAMVVGSANMMATIGIPKFIGIVIMGVFIASFAGTTLDTATRIQRYIIAELATDIKLDVLANRWIATGIAVVSALILAFATGAHGKGALTLWPLFGAINQILAALALLVITVYLKRKGPWFWLTLIPFIFMIIMTIWGLFLNIKDFVASSNWLLVVIGGICLVLSAWLVIEGILVSQACSSHQ